MGRSVIVSVNVPLAPGQPSVLYRALRAPPISLMGSARPGGLGRRLAITRRTGLAQGNFVELCRRHAARTVPLVESWIHRHSAEPSKYRPRQPTQTLLYQIVAEHLETFLACAAEQQNSALPRYVQKELRKYLECGVFAHGFLRARCSDCGKDLLVAFSCKRRGVCPSCNARRMCATAAHLVDHVLGDIPVRQWVLSVPYELRLLLAKSPVALNAVARLFVEQITRFQRERARAAGIEAPKTGAIVFPQRFGGSLNLNVHFHVAVPGGVYTVANNSGNETATANFHPLAQPTQRDLDEITHNVDARVCAWLRRKEFLKNESECECNDAVAQPSALDACLVASLGVGELTSVSSAEGQLPEERPARPAKAARRPGSSNGFNLHAGVVIASDDRAGRERLLRYCARPPLSMERMSLLPGGRIAYAIRTSARSKRSHRVMTPLQFLARLCALIPPPRHPLIRFHGVFAPHSRARAAVIPKRAIAMRPHRRGQQRVFEVVQK